ncbi:phospho-acceptor domain-containing protein [Algoriphagus antarcticus]|uniref:histidine kinase n=1 Tax=Algoriphagus antarcticus TaxID=238540 RepID=A0A3E0E163_9BACT|nr:ATP-binding protein [Algoriphagus antarcticus]REG91069.1 phospho-acceptor domain-containing protein [Algoriphagus antarcticus]
MKLAEAAALTSKAYQYNAMGGYSEAFQHLLQALKIAEDPKNEEVQEWKVTQYPIPGKNRLIVISTTHHVLGGLMRNAENPEQEILHLKEALQIAVQINHPDRQMTSNMNLASVYFKLNQPDSAFYFAKVAQVLSENPLAQGYVGNNMLTIGDIYLAKGDTVQAKKKYYEGLKSSNKQNNQADIANLSHRLIRVYLMENSKDSALSYAVKNSPVIKSIAGVGYMEIDMGVAYEDLYLAYKLNNQPDSAYKYQGLALVTKDSLYKIKIKNLADFQKLSLGEALRLENLEKEKIQTQSKIRTYGMMAGLAVLSIIGFILYRNNWQKQKANLVLQEQKQKVETILLELKSTQSQLIQSEKMASLGELTAGIAHEIQNPLNFVNNFSEVSNELIGEIEEERTKSQEARDEELVSEILRDVKENLSKIAHHGKRADAIVKGMLEHSRKSSGEKVLTDINALADEYLRLSYHGMRAKDKTFNADFKTEFDPNLPKVAVIPQDIGRVLLNIINNAFYDCREKDLPGFVGDNKRNLEGLPPTVIISTKNLGSKIEISVKDNGPAIPDAIKDKIFQPFFTTKLPVRGRD